MVDTHLMPSLHYKINSSYYQWGPLLYYSKVEPLILKELDKTAKKSKHHFNHKLSKLKKEPNFSPQNIKKFKLLLQPYLNAFCLVYNSRCNSADKFLKKLELENIWANYQTNNEWRPPHYHTNCEASFVIYLDIPSDLKTFTDVSTEYQPGAVVFDYHRKDESRNYFKSINKHVVFPQRGDIFIFPYDLNHYTVPFYNTKTRVSISGNLIVA